MSSGATVGVSNGTAGSQSTIDQFNSEIDAIRNEQRVSDLSKAPIQRPGDLRYNKKKAEGYLLNKDHPQGGPKAKFMEDVLGYSKADSRKFHKAVVDSLIGKIPGKTQQTEYGLKHTYNTKIKGKNGKSTSANVVVVIQKDNKRITYRIITVYPDRKDKL